MSSPKIFIGDQNVARGLAKITDDSFPWINFDEKHHRGKTLQRDVGMTGCLDGVF